MTLAPQIYEFGPFRLDTSKRLLMRDLERAPLKPKCYEILAALVEASGEVVSKESLIERVWPDSFVEDGNLTYNISILRKALGERAGEHKYIVTVPGRGYQFVEKVRELTNEGADAVATPADFVSFETAARSQQKARVALEPARGRSDPVSEPFFSSITRNKRGVLLGAAMLVIAGAGIGFGLFRFISMKQSDSRASEPFESTKIARLTTTGNASLAAISPDGKYVVHARGSNRQQSLWISHIATGSDKEIVPTSDAEYTALTFSPDGNYLYFVRLESLIGTLYRAPVLGGSIQKLLADVDSGITFSPDGRQMVYIRGYPQRNEARLITANAGGGEEQTILIKFLADVSVGDR